MKCLIDADILVYKVGFSSQRTSYQFVYNNGSIIEFGDLSISQVKSDLYRRLVDPSEGKLQQIVTPIPLEFCLQRCRMLIESILENTGADSYQLYLTSNDKSNYRFKLATLKEYKGNRKNSKKPFHYDSIREYIMKYWDGQMVYDQEADDAMGIAQMKSKGSTIIASIDKDVNMIPDYHYDIDTEEIYIATDPGELFLTDKRNKIFGRGLKWFYAQILLGDTADNIPGIPGYGPVNTYNKLQPLETELEFLDTVKGVYKAHYKDKSTIALREVMNLLWIRRYENEMKGDIL